MSGAPDPSPFLSARARSLLQRSPLPAYLREHFARSAAGNDAPGRSYIPLCVAKNRLVYDLLPPKLDAPRQDPARALAYDAMIGAHRFREQIAVTMERLFLG